MNHTVLCAATEHYRDSGYLGFSMLRRFSASITRTDMKVGTDVRHWHTTELRRFLVEQYGDLFPHHGLPDDDWDPQQHALADAVLHINHADEGTNLAWQAHIGTYLSKVVGFSPRRHEAVTLASFLVQRQATVPGRGPLHDFSVATERRPGERGHGAHKVSKEGAWWTGDRTPHHHPGTATPGASGSHQEAPYFSAQRGWDSSAPGDSSAWHSGAWENRSWNRPSYQGRGHEQQTAWRSSDDGTWAPAGWHASASQEPRPDAQGWTRQANRQDNISGTGESVTDPGAPPPWRSEAAGWPRPRAEPSPTHGGRGSALPPFPRAGAVREGTNIAPGYFIQQLQRISFGWSQTWSR